MNNVTFTKRLLAYILDFIFIGAILMILSYFIPRSTNFDFLNSDMNDLTEQAMNNEITFEAYLREYSNYLSDVDKENVIYNSTSFIILVIYYVIIPIFTGCTLGKYIMHLKYKHKDDKKIGILNTFTRSIIDIGLVISLITVFLVQIVSAKTYFIVLIILCFIQIILVITSGFMILYRRDKRSLSDILSRTDVVIREVK